MKRLLLTALAAASLAVLPAAQTIELEVALSGAHSVPVNSSTASGHGKLSLDLATSVLSYDVTVSGMTATASHIHNAPAGSSGGVVLPFLSVGPNHFMGSGPMSGPVIGELLSNRLYINVHSSAVPAGEVRGQILMPRHLVAPDMSGANATPPNSSGGSGEGRLQYEAATHSFSYDIKVSGMSGTITAAHVHNAPPGSGGPILFGLTQTGPTSFAGNTAPQSPSVVSAVLSGDAYINVHSTFAPSGELRDQIHAGYLNTDTPAIGVASGGKQTMNWETGSGHAGEFYLLLGSLSGTSPGLPAGGGILPLNFDSYFTLTLGGGGPLSSASGFLDANGAAQSVFSIPPGLTPALVGIDADHAGVALDLTTLGVSLITNAVPLSLL